jgi:hypothetical protein
VFAWQVFAWPLFAWPLFAWPLCAWQLAGCATITVKSDATDSSIIVDGQALGSANPDGTKVEIGPGLDPVPYEIVGPDGSVTEGSIVRSEPVWWVLALAGAGVLCCTPSLLASGFFVSNLGICSGPLLFLLSGCAICDVGSLTRSFTNPSWLTVPTMAVCGTLGLAPAGVALLAEAPPEVVELNRVAQSSSSDASPANAPAQRF